MHIPDGFLGAGTLVSTAVLSAAVVTQALRVLRRDLPARRVPLIGLTAAFVFAAQMLNFPVAAGTSGHLIGAALATVLLGPAAAIVTMTAVLLLQCLMFADGGLLALGANVLNLAVIAPLSAWAVLRLMRRSSGDGVRPLLVAAGFAAWCSTVAAALACALELSASGVVGLRTAVFAMGGVHMLIGLGEAVITMLVLAVVVRARPELIEVGRGAPAARVRRPVRYAAVLAIVTMLLAAPFASRLPDGLERVAGELGFAARATSTAGAPLGGYEFPWLMSGGSWLGVVIAGALGASVAYLAAWVLARTLAAAPGKLARR